MRRDYRGVTLLICLLLAGCPGAVRWDTPPPPAQSPPARPAPSKQPLPKTGVHVVQQGETLYGIAFRYGLDARALARWNQLGSGDFILPGQRLRLIQPPRSQSVPRAVKTPSEPAPKWKWPAKSALRSKFGGPGVAGKGIEFAGASGDPVYAAAAGKVVYSGSGLRGYGKLIIVKHNTALLSAYGYNNTLLVNEGDLVRVGQRIAGMGSVPGTAPGLHFEIRLGGKPVDPLDYLPSR